MAGAVCIGGAPATLANAFVRPRVNDGERQRPLERLANGLLSWLSLLPATLFSAKAAAASKNLWISRAQNSDADNARLLFGWQGKLRGLDFEPPLFRIENMSSPDILNVAGKKVKIPVMLPISHAEAQDREDQIGSGDALNAAARSSCQRQALKVGSPKCRDQSAHDLLTASGD
jgi:hypothetical protein